MLPNHLPQPHSYRPQAQPPTPEPVLEDGAFASQLDEIDRLLRAFRLQRQDQSVSQRTPPADDDTDEKLMNSESDEESGGRLSSSTEERGAGAGRGAASGAARTGVGVSLMTEEGKYPFGGTLAGQVGGGALGGRLEGWESEAGFGGLPSAAKGGESWRGQRLVGRGVGREEGLDDRVLSRLRAGVGNGSGEPCKMVERCLENSGSGGALVHPDRLETAREESELLPVRRASLDRPLDDEWDDQDTKERTQEGFTVEI